MSTRQDAQHCLRCNRDSFLVLWLPDHEEWVIECDHCGFSRLLVQPVEVAS